MLLSTLTPLLLLPFAAANGLHRLKLNKLPPTPNHLSYENAYLAEKYAPQSFSQRPFMGAGGAGRRVNCPANNGGQDLYHTQVESQGGHSVPLSSSPNPIFIHFTLTISLLDFMNAQYYTEISLGSPAQTVR